MKGNLTNTDDTATIYDVAREAGSMATVSRVVNEINVKENTHKSFRSDRTLISPNVVVPVLLARKQQQSVLWFQTSRIAYFWRHWPGIDTLLKCTSTVLFLRVVMKTMTKKFPPVVNNLFSKQVDGIIVVITWLKRSAQNFTPASCPCWDSGCWTPITRCHWLQASNCWC